jgi:hypothetical protein
VTGPTVLQHLEHSRPKFDQNTDNHGSGRQYEDGGDVIRLLLKD